MMGFVENINNATTEPLKSAIESVGQDPLKQAILDVSEIDVQEVADNASAAATSASNASTSETNAAASETSAAASETNAATSETNAATSEVNALASAGNAATSEANAVTSETNAAISEAAAAAILDAFDDTYLGAYAENPLVDNDGDPLQNGAIYFNSVSNALYVYDLDSTTWIVLPVNNLASLSDVNITGIQIGSLLRWNGSEFVVDSTRLHDDLTDTSDNDLHPINSITGLQTELNNRYTETEVKGTQRLQSNKLLELNLDTSLDFVEGTGVVSYDAPSTSTYVDMYGKLQYAEIDEPRFNDKGMRFDAESTNRMLNSDSVAIDGTGTGTILANAILGPDGVTLADSIEDTSSSVTQYVQKVILGADTTEFPANTYTGSWYIKAGTSSHCLLNFQVYVTTTTAMTAMTGYIDLTNGMTSGNDFNVEQLGNGWYRVQATVTTSVDNRYCRLLTYPATGDNDIDVTAMGTVYVTGFQIEEYPTATSYIPTTDTAVTRLKTETYLETKGNIPRLDTGAGCFFTITPETLGESTRIFSINFNGSADIRPYFTTSNQFAFYILDKDGTAKASIFNFIFENNIEYKIGLSFDNGVISLYVDNIYQQSLTNDKLLNIDYSLMTDFVLGARYVGGGTEIFTGYIKSIKWVNYTPTAVEMTLN